MLEYDASVVGQEFDRERIFERFLDLFGDDLLEIKVNVYPVEFHASWLLQTVHARLNQAFDSISSIS